MIVDNDRWREINKIGRFEEGINRGRFIPEPPEGYTCEC